MLHKERIIIIDKIMYATHKYHVWAKMESFEQLTFPRQTVNNMLLMFYRSIGKSNQCFDVCTFHLVQFITNTNECKTYIYKIIKYNYHICQHFNLLTLLNL